MIIGLGTGRSGSGSLSEWLKVPHEFRTTQGREFLSELEDHDKTKWFVDLATISRKFGFTYGDVSLDHIHNLDYFIEHKTTVICVMRDKEETVNSITHHSKRIFKRLFPEHDFDTKKGIGAYWEWYYDTVLKHPEVIIISPEQIPHKANKGAWREKTKVSSPA